MAKPRNLIGIAKDIPPGEMEALLLANIAVAEDAMRELALQRGVAVKEYLAQKQVPPERLFLGAAKPGAIDAKWTPRAELNCWPISWRTSRFRVLFVRKAEVVRK